MMLGACELKEKNFLKLFFSNGDCKIALDGCFSRIPNTCTEKRFTLEQERLQ